jgi:hypothetical protein
MRTQDFYFYFFAAGTFLPQKEKKEKKINYLPVLFLTG